MAYRADLHMHTFYSDGGFSPEYVAKRSKELLQDVVAICDHDTVEGFEKFKKACDAEGICAVTGIEVSAYIGITKIHTLGLGMDIGEPKFKLFLQELKENSYLRTKEVLKNLTEVGVKIPFEKVLDECVSSAVPIHTVYIARAGAKILNIQMREFFKNYLSYKKAGYCQNFRPSPESAAKIISYCGGVASLAHPARIRFTDGEDINSLIKRLKPFGLSGIEGVYTTHTDIQTAYYKELAAKNNLYVTGGSDFHFEGEGEDIGNTNFIMDSSLAEKLRIEKKIS